MLPDSASQRAQESPPNREVHGLRMPPISLPRHLILMTHNDPYHVKRMSCLKVRHHGRRRTAPQHPHEHIPSNEAYRDGLRWPLPRMHHLHESVGRHLLTMPVSGCAEQRAHFSCSCSADTAPSMLAMYFLSLADARAGSWPCAGPPGPSPPPGPASPGAPGAPASAPGAPPLGPAPAAGTAAAAPLAPGLLSCANTA